MLKIVKLAPLALLLATTSAGVNNAEPAMQEQAADGVHVGIGVICDTQDEVSRFVKTLDTLGAGGAIAAINRDSNNPAACGLATIAYRNGKEINLLRTDKGSYTIMSIDIIAAASGDGAWHQIARQTQFTAVKLEGLEI